MGDAPIELTSMADGVQFDLLGSGFGVRTGWVRAGALLALDLDGNGTIDGGQELFGDHTRRLDGGRADDGFAALAEYDTVARGGNGNGLIDAEDAIFSRLLLWQDRNQDGSSASAELTSLSAARVETIDLAASHQSSAPFRLRESGHMVGLWSNATLEDGRAVELVDVWFEYGH
jgi:hypothetical protein